MPDVIIWDFDGTLVDCDPIAHLWGDWDDFHLATFDCPPRLQMVELARRCQLIARNVVVTGKPERYRAKMISWLALHGLQPEALLMRPDSSMMSDKELKPALLIEWLGADWKEAIICVVEDRDKMVDAWRAEGILCLQAAPCLETKIRKERDSGKSE